MITIKSKKEVKIMREGGRMLAKIMDEIAQKIAPGISTQELNKLAEKLVFVNGGTPSFKGYGRDTGNPFPATLCTSVNSEIVHGIPSEKIILKEGDVLNVDIGMCYRGFHTDMARTYGVGKISQTAQKLIDVTRQSFWEGIKNLSAGSMLSQYSKATQAYVEKNGFSVVRNLVGHGVGRNLHEDPSVPNFFSPKYDDVELVAGMTLALEPMVNEGTYETMLGSDGWVFKTKDGKLAAHYENTILITKKGVEVLTIHPVE